MTGRTVVRGGTVLTPGGRVPGDVVIEGGRVVAVDDGHQAALDTTIQIDAAGLLVAPGFIDAQINGGHGIDLATSPERLWELGALLPAVRRHRLRPDDRHLATGRSCSGRSPPCTTPGAPPGRRAGRPPPRRSDARTLSAAAPTARHCCSPLVGARSAGWTRGRRRRMVTLAPELPGALDVIGSSSRKASSSRSATPTPTPARWPTRARRRDGGDPPVQRHGAVRPPCPRTDRRRPRRRAGDRWPDRRRHPRRCRWRSPPRGSARTGAADARHRRSRRSRARAGRRRGSAATP